MIRWADDIFISAPLTHFIIFLAGITFPFYIVMCILTFSAHSSRSEPSPKAARQSLSIKQAFLGGKSDGRIHSPHSPKAGEERRALKGKDTSPRFSVARGCFYHFREVIYVNLTCQMRPVHLETELPGNLALQGSWEDPLRKRLQLGSCLECDSMTVRLHRLTGWISVSTHVSIEQAMILDFKFSHH